MIWGIDNDTHEITGTEFDKDVVTGEGGQPLELWLRLVIKPQVAYDFHSVVIDGHKVVLLEVEAAYREPVTFHGFGWARIGNSLTELNKAPKIAAAIYRAVGRDWSAEVVPSATVDDLDRTALDAARAMYTDKHKDDIFAPEITAWGDVKFLNKARLAIDGKLTRACLVLLAKPEKALYDSGRPRLYPNKQLADAMVELKMIDTLGSGIRRMFVKQRDRFMPMPDYDIADDAVTVGVPGRILDARYCSLLMKKADLTLEEIVLLDRVQKGQSLDSEPVKFLRKRGLVEGRKNNLMISAAVAAATDKKAAYIKTRSANDKNLRRMILDYLEQWKRATRKDIEELLMDKLPDILSIEQKKTKISTLLTWLRKHGMITNESTDRASMWVLCLSVREIVSSPRLKLTLRY